MNISITLASPEDRVADKLWYAAPGGACGAEIDQWIMFEG